jgi:hypothetical protein
MEKDKTEKDKTEKDKTEKGKSGCLIFLTGGLIFLTGGLCLDIIKSQFIRYNIKIYVFQIKM